MRIVWSWLSELCEFERDVSADEAAEALTRVGMEVETTDVLGEQFSGVVVAEVASREPHPKADRLTLVKVRDAEGGEVTEVVCGAKNVPEPGGRVLWAKPGAVLPGDFRIGARELKGVMSAGMLCSEKELDIGDDDAGICVLEQGEGSLGQAAQDALGLRDVVFDIAVPANRPDALGHLGMARELCAALGGKVKRPTVKLAESAEAVSKTWSVKIEDADLCPRYTARALTNLTVKPSPRWVRNRLTAVGVRPISNLVDVTNYVMFELGHPLHAFDASKVTGKTISVRKSKKGETLKTLDDVDRKLSSEDLVIADEAGVIALAGVMGGQSTEVEDKTTSVLLEAATFAPRPVRRTARRLGLHSESSYRFERHVDSESVEYASSRAAQLLASWGGGTVQEGVVDVYAKKPETTQTTVRVARIEALAGFGIPTDKCKEVLSGLELSVKEKAGVLTCQVPSFRTDLAREVDLVEEVLRHVGLDNVPATLPRNGQSPQTRSDERPWRVRRALTRAGFYEAVTFGFVSEERTRKLGLKDDDCRLSFVRVKNPMNLEQAVMRTSLLPNLLSAVAHNEKHQVPDVRLFEVGSVFLASGKELPNEPVRAGAVLSGARPGWLTPGDGVDYYDAKAALDGVLVELLGRESANVTYAACADEPTFHPGVCARVEHPGHGVLGHVGEIHPAVREAFEIEGVCFGFDLDVAAIPAPGVLTMQPIPRHPATARDVSFFVDASVPAADIAGFFHGKDAELLESVTCLEDYRDPQRVPAGKKGMLWSVTYRAKDRTLTDKEVDKLHEGLVEELLGSFSAQRR